MQSKSKGKYKGIDISNWQGYVDFAKVKQDGYKIVYIKATEGIDYINPYMEYSYKEVKKNGLLVGFYHYFRPSIDPILQAEYFVDCIKDKDVDCRFALDIEDTEGYEKNELTDRCLWFLENVEKLTDKEVVVYTYTYFAKNNLQNTINKYPLWIANYGVDKPLQNFIWKTWIGFQYSNTGEVSGVDGNCDLDVFMEEIILKSNTENIRCYKKSRR